MTFGPYEIIQIDERSWRIESGFVRALLFAGAERALLVDTANVSGPLDEAVRSLTDKPVTLVNTHADPDHIGANDRFAEVWMHPAEFGYYAQQRSPGFAAPRPVWDGVTLDLGGRSFEVILVPGHTPGSIALYERETGVLVGGDSISSTPVFLFGGMRSPEAFEASLARLSERAADIRCIYPSHGVFPLGAEQIEKELACIRRLLRGELSPQEPPYPLPAKMYLWDGAGVYFIPEELSRLRGHLNG